MKRFSKFTVILLVLIFAVAMIAAASPESTYDKAFEAMVGGNYAEASELFASCSFYSDANTWAQYCNAQLNAENKNHLVAYQALTDLGDFADCKDMAAYCLAYYYVYEAGEDSSIVRKGAELFGEIAMYRDSLQLSELAYDRANAIDYRQAEALLAQGKYFDAQDMFLALGNYSDSAKRAAGCVDAYYDSIYKQAEALEANRKYEEARDVFLSISEYKDSSARAENAINTGKYVLAESYEASGKYVEAYNQFNALGSFKDSKSRAAALKEKAYYQAGTDAIREGDYSYAFDCLNVIPNYEDSKIKAYLANAVSVADTMERINDDVAVYCFDHEWGIIDFEKNTMAYPRWQGLEATAADVFIAKKNDLYGMTDSEGNILIQPRWTSYSFVNNRIVFHQEKDLSDQIGIATKTGQIVFDAQWKDLFPVSGELAIVTSTDGKFGVIDFAGNVISGCTWDAISGNLISGDFIVAEKDSDGKLQYYLMNQSGKLLNPTPYRKLGSAEDSFTAKFINGWMLCIDESGLYGYIAPDGAVIDNIYEDALEFANERAAVKLDGYWGYINTAGRLVVENKYIKATSFDSNGKAFVIMQNGQRFLLNKKDGFNYFIDSHYARAQELEAAGAYAEALAQYEAIPEYDDAPNCITRCREKLAQQLFAEGRYEEAKEQYNILGNEEQITACEEAIRLEKYNSAIAFETEEKYEEAKALFDEISDYRDVAEHLHNINGIVAIKFFEQGLYEEAKAAFKTLEGYEEEIAACDEQITLAKYEKALELEAAEDYDAAVKLFDEIKDYADSAEHLQRLNARYAYSLLTKAVIQRPARPSLLRIRPSMRRSFRNARIRLRWRILQRRITNTPPVNLLRFRIIKTLRKKSADAKSCRPTWRWQNAAKRHISRQQPPLLPVKMHLPFCRKSADIRTLRN